MVLGLPYHIDLPQRRCTSVKNMLQLWMQVLEGAAIQKSTSLRASAKIGLTLQVRMLSGGECRRLQLAAVLMARPNLLILDEARFLTHLPIG